MLRTAISRAGTSRLSSMVMPLVVALLSAMPGCDKDPAQAERRYCDQSGCFACVGENCYPVPGDAIVGFITRGRGVTIHTQSCDKALATDPERKVEVSWDAKIGAQRPVTLKVISTDRPGVL